MAKIWKGVVVVVVMCSEGRHQWSGTHTAQVGSCLLHDTSYTEPAEECGRPIPPIFEAHIKMTGPPLIPSPADPVSYKQQTMGHR